MQDPTPGQPQDPMPAAAFVVDDEPLSPDAPLRDDLDGTRIRRISDLRRSAYRSASYCVVGSSACCVGAAQFVWLAQRNMRRGDWGWIDSGYVLLAILAVFFGLRLWRRSRQLRRQAEQTCLPTPLAPPDFSALHDGSQPWTHLEKIGE